MLRVRDAHQGRVSPSRIVLYTAYTPPTFCDCCGTAHPWGTRENRLNQLQYLVEAEADPDRRKSAFAGRFPGKRVATPGVVDVLAQRI